MAVSIKDVAKDAGVSAATVSYVISKNKYVSPELTRKVEESINRLHYYGNPVARSLRNRQTRTIGVVLQNIRNIFFPQVLAGMEEYARSHNYQLIFANTYNDLHVEKATINQMKGTWVDGIILDTCVSIGDQEEYIRFLLSDKVGKQIPLVLLERNICTDKIRSISINNLQAGFEATRHLIDRGRRRIVHIMGNPSWCVSCDRRQGYLNALESAGLEGSATILTGYYRPQDGYETIKELLQRNHPFDAVFAANDQMAIGAMKAIKEMGRIIPDDIAVIGFDNIFASSMVDPSLSTMNVPKMSMGTAASKLIIEAIQNQQSPMEDVRLETNLIVRQSTDLRGEKGWDLYGW